MKNFLPKNKQLLITVLLFVAGLFLGLSLGMLILVPVETAPPQKVENEIPAKNAYKRPGAESGIINPDLLPSLGPKDAKVRVMEFSDYQCEFCRNYYEEVFKGTMKDYLDRGIISYTFLDYPLSTHPDNIDAAVSARCAGDQNKYYEMHNMLFTNQNMWSYKDKTNEVYKNFAQEIGLDLKKYDYCAENHKNLNIIQQNINLGKNLGVKLTPTVFINDIKVEGAQSPNIYIKLIEDELNGVPASDE